MSTDVNCPSPPPTAKSYSSTHQQQAHHNLEDVFIKQHTYTMLQHKVCVCLFIFIYNLYNIYNLLNNIMQLL